MGILWFLDCIINTISVVSRKCSYVDYICNFKGDAVPYIVLFILFWITVHSEHVGFSMVACVRRLPLIGRYHIYSSVMHCVLLIYS